MCEPGSGKAALPFEEEAVHRAVPVSVGDRDVFFCTAEDQILMEIISERERDLADARAVLDRRREVLDLRYLDPRVAELSQVMERPEILRRWQDWKAAAAPER